MDRYSRRHSESPSSYEASVLQPNLKHSGPTANHVLSTVHPNAAGLPSTSTLQAELSSPNWERTLQHSSGSTFEAVFRPPSAPAAAPAAAGAAQAAGLTLPHISPDDIMQLADYFGEDDIEVSHQQIPSASNSAACTANLSHHSGFELQHADAQDLGCSSNSTPSVVHAAGSATYLQCADLTKLAVPDQLPGVPYPSQQQQQQQQQQMLDHAFSVNSWQTAVSPEASAACYPPGVMTGPEYPCISVGIQGCSSLRSSTSTCDGGQMVPKHPGFLAVHMATAATDLYPAAVVSPGSAGESRTQGSPASPPAAAAVSRGRGAAPGVGCTAASRRREPAVDQRREVNRLTQQRLRRERQAEHMKLRDQIAIMTDQVTRLQASVRSQQASHSELLSRLGEVTGKWRDSVAENARLSADNVAVRAQVADLQMQLMMYQAQQQHHHQQQWAGM